MSRYVRLGCAAWIGAAAVALASAPFDCRIPIQGPPPTPNLIFDVSHPLARAYVERVDITPENVKETIQKADVRGKALSKSFTTVELVPDDQQASLDFVVYTQADSVTNSTRGPVIVHNTGVTRIVARKRVRISPRGLQSDPTTVCARVENDLLGIETTLCLLDPLVTRLSERGYYRRYEQGRAEGEALTRYKTAANMDKEMQVELDKGTKYLTEELPESLDQYSMKWDWSGFRTTKDVLALLVQVIDASHYPLPTAPPPLPNGLPAMTMRMHESFLNTGAFYNLSGQTYNRKRVDREMKTLPDALRKKIDKVAKKQDEDEEEPFEVTFTKDDPLVVHFADDRVKITVRNARFKSGDDEVKRPWSTTVTYKATTTPRGVAFVREGPVQSAVLDKKPLGATGTAARTLLQKRLTSLLPMEIVPDDIEMPEDQKHVGKLHATQVRSTQGWLLLGFERVPPPHEEPAKKKEK